MVNEIMTAITLKLDSVYGDSCRYYGDRDEIQDLDPPCFFVSVLQPSMRLIHDRRYMSSCPFDIAYFPAAEGDHAAMNEIGDQLFEALEYITQADGVMLRGTDMNYDIVDGILHFRVTYNSIHLKTGDDPFMEQLEQIHSMKTEA